MQRIIQSFGWAMNGIRITWREEVNFRIELLFAFGVIALGMRVGLSVFEWVVIVGCIVAVLSAEMINTAIEDLCNKVEPNIDPMIGKIKDVMSGFVFMIVIGVVIIGTMIFSRYL